MQKWNYTDTIVSIQCRKNRNWKNGGNMFYPSLGEKKKLEIARLYNTTNMPMENIADKVGVCLKTAYNHRNYGYETDIDLTSSTTSEAKIESSQSKKDRWECKKCGYITDTKVTICPRCQWGPFHSIFTKIGSPGHVPYVAPQKEPEITEPEKEVCDPTRDYWICKECDHISNTEFDICPECGCKEIIFAPNGIEPRDDYDQSTSEDRQDGSDQTEDVGNQQVSNQDIEQTEFDEETSVTSGAPKIHPEGNVEPEDKDTPWILPAVLVCGGAVTLLAARPDIIQKLFQAFQNGDQIGAGFESTRPQFLTKKQMSL